MEPNHRGLIRQRQIPVGGLQPKMAFGRQVDKQLIGGWPPQGEIRVKDTAQILKLNLRATGARPLALKLGLGQGPQLVAEGEALGVEHQCAQIEGPAGWGQG